MYDPVFAAAPEKKLLLVFVLSDIIHVCGKRATEEEVAAYDAVRPGDVHKELEVR